MDEIDVKQAHQRLGEFRIVDVRAEHEFHGPLGHISGAELLPLGEIDSAAETLRSERTLLMVCRSGGRSGMACEKLRSLGVGPVVNLVGGMIAWNRAGLPVEEHAPASLEALRDFVVAWYGQLGGQGAARAADVAREVLAEAGASFDDPSREALVCLLERAEEELGGEKAPPDLGMSLAAFRRALERL